MTRALGISILVVLISHAAAGSSRRATRNQGQADLTYDLSTQSLTYRDGHRSVRDGSMVRFKITGFNPYLYQVIVNGTPLNRFTDQSKDAAAMLLGKKGTETPTKLASPGPSGTTMSINVVAPPPPPKPPAGTPLPFPRYASAFITLGRLSIAIDAVMHSDGLEPASIKTEVDKLLLTLPTIEPLPSVTTSSLLVEYINRVIDTLDVFGTSPEKDKKWKERWESFDERAYADLRKHAVEIQARAGEALALVQTVERTPLYVMAPPIQATGDAIKYSLEVKRLEGVATKFVATHTSPKSDLIDIPVLGGFKVDFSSGVFVSGLTSHNYCVTPGKTIGFASSRDKFDPGAGLLLIHAYWRSCDSFNVSLPTVGIGLTASQRTDYLLGVGLLMGKKQRVNLSGGLAGGQVKVLGGGRVFGESYGGDTASLPLVDRFRLSWFLALTFNL